MFTFFGLIIPCYEEEFPLIDIYILFLAKFNESIAKNTPCRPKKNVIQKLIVNHTSII